MTQFCFETNQKTAIHFTTYQTIPPSIIKEKASENAIKKRNRVKNFNYDFPEYELSLGFCEDRPIGTDQLGNIYLG